MGLKSIKIVQTKFYSLSSIPFKNIYVRKNLDSIFNNKKCFTDNSNLYMHGKDSIAISNAPFISSAGAIVFNTRQLYFNRKNYAYSYNDDGSELLKLLSNTSEMIDLPNIFGYNHKIADQRKNFLYFELKTPIKIESRDTKGNKTSDGTIYIHMYPSGYIVLHIVINIVSSILKKYEVGYLLDESKPWKYNNYWHWSCKKLNLSCKLPELIDNILVNISTALFPDENQLKNDNYWYASLLFSSNDSNTLYKLKSKINLSLNVPIDDDSYFRTYNFTRYLDFNDDDYVIGGKKIDIKEELRVDDRISYFLSGGKRVRSNIVGSYWKRMHIIEFSLYSQMVYKQYIIYIKDEIIRMKQLRLDKKQKMKTENVLGHDFYQADVFSFLNILDKFYNSLSPFYKGMYDYISNRNGTYKEKDALISLIKDWEAELIEWKDKDSNLKQSIETLKNLYELFLMN